MTIMGSGGIVQQKIQVKRALDLKRVSGQFEQEQNARWLREYERLTKVAMAMASSKNSVLQGVTFSTTTNSTP